MTDETERDDDDSTSSAYYELDNVLNDSDSSEANYDAWSDLTNVGIKSSTNDERAAIDDESKNADDPVNGDDTDCG